MSVPRPTVADLEASKVQVLSDIDGRTKAFRRFVAVTDAIQSDLGGKDTLSEGQKQLSQRCALLALHLESMEAQALTGVQIDMALYGNLTDRLGRQLSRLGLQRSVKDVTLSLDDYLASKKAATG